MNKESAKKNRPVTPFRRKLCEDRKRVQIWLHEYKNWYLEQLQVGTGFEDNDALDI